MNILVVGSAESQAEFKLKFGSGHSIASKSCAELQLKDVMACDLIFDFEISVKDQHGQLYHQNPKAALMVNSVKTTVIELVKHFRWRHSLVGFNGLPGMFNRPLLELSIDRTDAATVEILCKQLGTGYRIVQDRVGMVTPRVVCMIINEAFYAVQEGTANEQDIDLAMKLGTNYPAGPFEMLKSIGIRYVYELLEALHQDTGELRYKVCPLLKKKYLNEA